VAGGGFHLPHPPPARLRRARGPRFLHPRSVKSWESWEIAWLGVFNYLIHGFHRDRVTVESGLRAEKKAKLSIKEKVARRSTDA
jgi:hypothetical protein